MFPLGGRNRRITHRLYSVVFGVIGHDALLAQALSIVDHLHDWTPSERLSIREAVSGWLRHLWADATTE